MSTSGVEIPIRATGADGATSSVDRFADSLSHAGDSAREFAAGQERAMRQAIELTGRVASAGGQVADFGRRIDNQMIAALGSLTQRTAASAQQFAALGSALGPQGALVGGIVGAMLPALAELADSQDTAARAAREHAEALAEVRAQMAADDSARRSADISEGVFGSDMTQERYREERMLRTRRQTEIARTISEEGDLIHSLARFTAGITQEAHDARMQQLSRESGALQDQIENLDRWSDRTQRAAVDTMGSAGGSAAASDEETPTRGGRGRARHLEEEIDLTEMLGDIVEEYDQTLAENHRREQERNNDIKAIHAEKIRNLAEVIERENEAEDRRAARAMERMERQQEIDREMIEANRARTRESREETREYAEFVGAANTMFIDAITQTIAGTKSAEEAFKGLLKGFLEMISQQAALKAAFEFGEAIASAARNDWVAAPQHIAAGVAYTAVAIAAGVGAAALAPPQMSAPAEPSKTDGGTGRGGGDTIINWSAPVYTSSQKAEMGRELRGLIRNADSRYGG